MKYLSKLAKYSALFLLVMLASTVTLSLGPTANAQDEGTYPPNPRALPSPPPSSETAIVAVIASTGGTSDPAPGTYTYNYGDTITLTATPDSGFKFLYWIICGTYTPGHNIPPINYPENAYTDPNWTPSFPPESTLTEDNLVTSTNPLSIKCGYGYTFAYQPVFTPVLGTPPSEDNAVVVVLSATGGTTDPGPGTYTYLPDQTIDLEATPDSGFDFQYWIATGTVPGHDAILLDSKLAINCQAGYAYSYQPVFTPVGSTTSGGGVPAEYFYAIIIILVIIAVIGIGAALMYRGRSKSK